MPKKDHMRYYAFLFPKYYVKNIYNKVEDKCLKIEIIENECERLSPMTIECRNDVKILSYFSNLTFCSKIWTFSHGLLTEKNQAQACLIVIFCSASAVHSRLFMWDIRQVKLFSHELHIALLYLLCSESFM